ncbi:DUF1853 family protein [Chromobacterium phragmitis]|uniref:DUF1853 family protein n=1 Tax=Chromobacterium phragmitis TaxID=2202141 RepID=UPI001F297942|nr:DUF1853 family protein [Chromobacterium phragmitis]
MNRERRTVGEFDCLLWMDGEPWHQETASKLYPRLDDTPEKRVGPGLNDAWRLKATKTATQLQRALHPDAAGVLPDGLERCHAPSSDQLQGWHAPRDAAWPRRCGGSRWGWLPLGWKRNARMARTRCARG